MTEMTGDISVRRKNVRVDLEWIGEGVSGDYQADDPEDKRLTAGALLEFAEEHGFKTKPKPNYTTSRLVQDIITWLVKNLL